MNRVNTVSSKLKTDPHPESLTLKPVDPSSCGFRLENPRDSSDATYRVWPVRSSCRERDNLSFVRDRGEILTPDLWEPDPTCS